MTVPLLRRAQCARGVGILDLAQNISAAVVVVHPRCILMRIVHANQLAQGVVLIRRGQVAALLAGDVPSRIVFIFERDAVLSNLLHQRRGAVRTISAVHVFIGARQLGLQSHQVYQISIHLAIHQFHNDSF